MQFFWSYHQNRIQNGLILGNNPRQLDDNSMSKSNTVHTYIKNYSPFSIFVAQSSVNIGMYIDKTSGIVLYIQCHIKSISKFLFILSLFHKII